ncbi:unnamed protein product, partial [Adineta steineri]
MEKCAIRLIKRRKQLEFNRQVTDSLNIGQQHLKHTHKLMPTKKNEDIIDDITEQMKISNDINHLNTADFDLENELNILNSEIF